MNKALHVFIYLFLILTGAALYFMYETFLNKEEMSDRNKALRDTIIEASAYIEKDVKYSANEACPDAEKYKIDISPLTAEMATSGNPEMKDVLAEAEAYRYSLEDTVHDPLAWGKKERDLLRNIYEIDPMTGKPLDDGTAKMTADSDAVRLLRKFVESLRKQKDQFAKTREAIPSLRKQVENLVAEVNDLKPQIRKDRKTIEERDASISDLNEQKTKLEGEIVDKKAQIDQLNVEITSLRDDITTARQETEAAKEELEKEKDMVSKLKKMIQDLQKSMIANVGSGSSEIGAAVTSLPAGDKGKILEANNEAAFAIIEVTPEAMMQLKGNDIMRPLPMLDFPIKRPGFNGPAGEIVGRVRLRQEVPGKNWIVCDILSNWTQAEIKKNDIVFAD